MARYPTTDMCDGALLEAFEPSTRSTDVFCATAAKCGQTWLMTLMHHLRLRGLGPDTSALGAFEHMPWLEIPRDVGGSGEPFVLKERLAQLEALEDPRIFKMHVLWDEIPRPTGSPAQIVTVTRDLRDVPYSMYSHLKGMQRKEPFEDDFDSYFERWMEFGYAFKFVRSFWPHHNDKDVLWLRYEDMQVDLKAEAIRIVEFLGWELSEADIDRALPLAGFAHMQKTEDERKKSGASSWKKGARFFREGGVGKNRARLSPEQESRILARAKAEFDPACLAFVMSQGL